MSMTKLCSPDPTNNGLVRHKMAGNMADSRVNHKSFQLFETPGLFDIITTYINYIVLAFFGVLQNFMIRYGFRNNILIAREVGRAGYPYLYEKFNFIYCQHVYRRIRDCWNNPINSCPGATVNVMDQITNDHGWTMQYPGSGMECLNFGSYNYLGFAQNTGPCADDAERITRNYGIGTCSTRIEMGTTDLHVETEGLIAEFLGVDDCLITGMGYATNTMNIPVLAGPGCLILSDELNHASIIVGIKISGATVRLYKHMDLKHLEKKLRDAIAYGQPRKFRPWKKIIIFCEGVYSMEGSVVNLPALIALKNKYKAYIYLDEAHSIGAMGPRGRGIVDYFGCDPQDIDILMGTFTKSFGSAGGYIAGKKDLIDYLRVASHSLCYATTMSAPVAQQIITTTKIIMGKDGTSEGMNRIRRLAWNTRYFRYHLHKKGFLVYGNNNSPVVPLLMFKLSKLSFFFRHLRTRGIVTAVVGYPATSLTTGRARFCLSAAHTKEMLDQALAEIDQLGDLIKIKYSRLPIEKKFYLNPGENFESLDGKDTRRTRSGNNNTFPEFNMNLVEKKDGGAHCNQNGGVHSQPNGVLHRAQRKISGS